jgi:hypothetical protein
VRVRSRPAASSTPGAAATTTCSSRFRTHRASAETRSACPAYARVQSSEVRSRTRLAEQPLWEYPSRSQRRGLPSPHRHNFKFTSELKFALVHDAAVTTTIGVQGDDDTWVFVNGRLAVDVGSFHVPRSRCALRRRARPRGAAGPARGHGTSQEVRRGSGHRRLTTAAPTIPC